MRLIRLFRWTGLVDAVQERTALDEVGAPDEPVVSDPKPPDEIDAKPPTPRRPTSDGDSDPDADSDSDSDPDDPDDPDPDPAPAPRPQPNRQVAWPGHAPE